MNGSTNKNNNNIQINESHFIPNKNNDYKELENDYKFENELDFKLELENETQAKLNTSFFIYDGYMNKKPMEREVMGDKQLEYILTSIFVEKFGTSNSFYKMFPPHIVTLLKKTPFENGGMMIVIEYLVINICKFVNAEIFFDGLFITKILENLNNFCTKYESIRKEIDEWIIFNAHDKVMEILRKYHLII